MGKIPITNIDDLEYSSWDEAFPPDQRPPSDRFGAKIARIGASLGARKLGYNVTCIEPGKAAYPLHNHRVNEEMFLILEGEGEIRFGKDRSAVQRGDLIACPPGGPQLAHQLRNTGSEPLKVLMVSTAFDTDVVEYPDSGKVAYGVRSTGEDGKPELLRGIARSEDQPGYWDGE